MAYFDMRQSRSTNRTHVLAILLLSSSYTFSTKSIPPHPPPICVNVNPTPLPTTLSVLPPQPSGSSKMPLARAVFEDHRRLSIISLTTSPPRSSPRGTRKRFSFLHPSHAFTPNTGQTCSPLPTPMNISVLGLSHPRTRKATQPRQHCKKPSRSLSLALKKNVSSQSLSSGKTLTHPFSPKMRRSGIDWPTRKLDAQPWHWLVTAWSLPP